MIPKAVRGKTDTYEDNTRLYYQQDVRLGSSLRGQTQTPTETPKPKNATLIGGVGCVKYLRAKGIPVPQNPLIYAKYLPVDSTELPPPGVKVILVSYMSPIGHVSWGYNDGGTLKVILDSDGIKEIPIGLYKGYVEV